MAGSQRRSRLARQIPYPLAAELLVTGKHIRAPEAREIGLIGHVVPNGQALARAHEIAELIAGNGPLAVAGILDTLHASEGKTEAEAVSYESRNAVLVNRSDDATEGPLAFAGKRRPNYRGQ